MSRFKILADSIISEKKEGDINKILLKVAKDNNLNSDEHQRLVEEYNIGSFLTKLQDGTQHEEYNIASPVTVESTCSTARDSNLNKIANYGSKMVTTEDMFYLDLEEAIREEVTLIKTASTDINSEIFTSEKKWLQIEQDRERMEKGNLEGLRKLAQEDTLFDYLGQLTKIASFSEGLVKSAISVLAMSDNAEAAEHLLLNSKFKIGEIADTNAEELPKEAKTLISKIIKLQNE